MSRLGESHFGLCVGGGGEAGALEADFLRGEHGRGSLARGRARGPSEHLNGSGGQTVRRGSDAVGPAGDGASGELVGVGGG